MQPNQPQQLQPSKDTPEHVKADYAQYVDKATIIIHSPDTRAAIMKMLQGPDPVSKVAGAAVMVMQRLDAAMRQAGIELLDAVKVFGANEVVHQLVELGNTAGFFKLDKDLTLLALSVASQNYIKAEVAAKRVNQKQLTLRLQADIRMMPAKQRKEMDIGTAKVQQIARKYNGGKGYEPR